MHDCPCCGQAVYSDAVVLCDYCRTEGPCAPEAWHCTCGRACDGTACPGEQYQAFVDYVEVSDDLQALRR